MVRNLVTWWFCCLLTTLLVASSCSRVHSTGKSTQEEEEEEGQWLAEAEPSKQDDGQRIKQLKWLQSDRRAVIRRSMSLFANATLTVGVVVREPFVLYNEPFQLNNTTTTSTTASTHQAKNNSRLNLENYSGIAIEVIKLMAEIFKFKIKLMLPEDGQFGVLVPEKGWSGLVGSIVRGECDVGLTALSITLKRAEVIDFTRAYYVETATILLPIVGEVQNYFAVFEPFSTGAWLLLLATILILVALITIMTKLEETQQDEQTRAHQLSRLLERRQTIAVVGGGGPTSTGEVSPLAGSELSGGHLKESGRNGQHSGQQALGRRAGGEKRQQSPDSSELLRGKLAGDRLKAANSHAIGPTWLERFYYAVSCVLNILLIRDIKNPPRQAPIRILVCVWWLSTIVIVNIYLGILFGQLVVPRRPPSIESLEELVAKEGQVEWCVTKGSAIYELFRQSKGDSVYGQLSRRMRTVASADEGVLRVVNSSWAYIRERSILAFKMAKVHDQMRACKLQLASGDFFAVNFGLGLARGSAYLEPFNAALTQMIESGLVARWRSMYWPARNQFTECEPKALREGEPLSMKHFISVYLVCSVIVLAALATLVYQRLHARKKRRARPSG